MNGSRSSWARGIRRLRPECLEERRVLAASMGWDGPGQGSAELSYYIAPHPSHLDGLQIESTIEQALKVWSDVADIDFVRTFQPSQLDSLDFSFREIDGAGGTLARAYFPDDVNPDRIAGDVHFDVSESWEVGNLQGSRAFDFLAVAVHEIGHALGLEHSVSPNSVLSASISSQEAFSGLDQDDMDAILDLYAARPQENLDAPLPMEQADQPNTIAYAENPTEQIDPSPNPQEWTRRTSRWGWFIHWGRTGFRGQPGDSGSGRGSFTLFVYPGHLRPQSIGDHPLQINFRSHTLGQLGNTARLPGLASLYWQTSEPFRGDAASPIRLYFWRVQV